MHGRDSKRVEILVKNSPLLVAIIHFTAICKIIRGVCQTYNTNSFPGFVINKKASVKWIPHIFIKEMGETCGMLI
jgi:hypothetical protein